MWHGFWQDVKFFLALYEFDKAIATHVHVSGCPCGVISPALKRMRVHGLVKRVGRTYKYYVTALGCAAITAGLMLKELFLVPALDTASIS